MPSADDLDNIAADLDTVDDSLYQLVRDAAGHEQAVDLIQNARDVVADARRDMERLAEEAREEEQDDDDDGGPEGVAS